jgi:hypothetical protein
MATLVGPSYPHGVSNNINLADPEFEPSDAQLIGLSHRAFAGVREANTRILEALHAQVERARLDALAALQVRFASARTPR